MSHLPIPKSAQLVIERGQRGIPAWAVQRALNSMGIGTVEDAAFGERTEANVMKMQQRLNTRPDGVVGPATQRALAVFLCQREESQVAGLPDRLLRSVVEGESGCFLVQVAWGSPGGVDCGITQRRVYEGDYDNEAVVKRAFDAAYQLDLLAKSLSELRNIFLSRQGTGGSNETAWRLAVLNHNYPYAADKISRYGVESLGSYWHTPQRWVEAINASFADGARVRTPYEWCCFYSLGSPYHNHGGVMTKYVQSWT